MSEFNAQQLEVINSNDRTILCLAAAGSGKTKTLLGRIARLVREGTDPRTILAITFTNAAAFEMKERYKKLPEFNLSPYVPEFRTFHGFCYSLIVKDPVVRKCLGYISIPEVCDESHYKKIRTTVKLALGIKVSDTKIDNGLLLRSEREQVELLNKAVSKELRKQNLITFDIICYGVCDLFVKDAPEIFKYKSQYKHIMCDEFQDTDKDQFKFLASFPATTNMLFTGDALQAIYAFRGCSNEFIKQLTLDPNWKTIKLFENYRSTTNICEFANKFTKYSKDEFRIEMHGQRDGDDVEVIHGSNINYDQAVDKKHLEILIEKLKTNRCESAVLCRTNKEVACVRSALADADIQVSARNKTGDTLNYLESTLSNQYFLDWISSKLEAKSYGDYIRLSAQVTNPDIQWFLQKYGNDDKVRYGAEKVIKIRQILNENLSVEEKFNQVTKLLRVKTKCEFNLEETATNKEIVISIRDQMQELEDAQIYVGTIHSAKGLEYDTVYVMGVNDSLFKLGTEEMNNLYYVSITRPKNHLVVFRR